MRRKSSRISSKESKESRLSLQQLSWKIPYNLDSFFEPLNEDAVAAVHNTALKILEEIGILFINPKASKILKKDGCKVDFSDSKVKMDLLWIMDMLRAVPKKKFYHTQKLKLGVGILYFEMFLLLLMS